MNTPITRIEQQVNAPRAAVYQALLSAEAVPHWMVPDGMTSLVHAFDAREGGQFRITLTYDTPTDTGKTTGNSDSFHGSFVRLIPDREVVQAIVFESDNAAMRGDMIVRYRLDDRDGGTLISATHSNLPPGVSPTDNERAWRMSLGKLARLVEAES